MKSSTQAGRYTGIVSCYHHVLYFLLGNAIAGHSTHLVGQRGAKTSPWKEDMAKCQKEVLEDERGVNHGCCAEQVCFIFSSPVQLA